MAVTPKKSGKTAAQPSVRQTARVQAQLLENVAASAASPKKPRRKAAVAPAALPAPISKAKSAAKAPAKTPAKAKAKPGAAKASAPRAKKVEAPAPLPVRIFQIHFTAQQVPGLDPDFEPYDNAGEPSPLREFEVFRKLARSPRTKGAELWGALSWKFGDKAGMTGAELRARIAANPGYDVYFCNPHPANEGVYHNLWLQGETAHPNFIALCTEFFKAAGLPVELLTEVQPSSAFASANYFVATPAFWERYLRFVETVLARAEKNLSPATRKTLYSPAADQKGAHAGACYLPFIVERLFSLFLLTAGKEFSACKLPANAEEISPNVHVRLLREMKDLAHSSRNLWLAACWVNYRNLYLAQCHDKAWMKKYLRAITPTDIHFAGRPAAVAEAVGA